MDVLGDVLAVLRTGRPRAMVLGWDPPWAQEFAAVPGAMGFQVVLRGACWLLPPEGEAVPLSAGDVVFRPYGRAHALASSPAAEPAPCEPGGDERPAGTTVVTLCGAYETSQTHPLVLGLPEALRVRPTDELRATVGLLAAEATEPRPGSSAVVPALLDTMLAHLLRQVLTGPLPLASSAPAGPLRDPVVAAALEAVHSDPARGWTVASLAAEAGLSRAAFARRFTAAAGLAPLAYLTRWRMTLAARRLRESDSTIAVVARGVGYANEYAFSTAFRRHHGVSPGRYRRQLRDAGAARELSGLSQAATGRRRCAGVCRP